MLIHLVVSSCIVMKIRSGTLPEFSPEILPIILLPIPPYDFCETSSKEFLREFLQKLPRNSFSDCSSYFYWVPPKILPELAPETTPGNIAKSSSKSMSKIVAVDFFRNYFKRVSSRIFPYICSEFPPEISHKD